MFANAQAGGNDAGFPDGWLTPAAPAPPIPVPYPNTAQGTMGIPAAYPVLFAGAPAHNMGTNIPLTNGDNAGVATGVASGTVMAKESPLTGAFTVLIAG